MKFANFFNVESLIIDKGCICVLDAACKFLFIAQVQQVVSGFLTKLVLFLLRLIFISPWTVLWSIPKYFTEGCYIFHLIPSVYENSLNLAFNTRREFLCPFSMLLFFIIILVIFNECVSAKSPRVCYAMISNRCLSRYFLPNFSVEAAFYFNILALSSEWCGFS